MKLFSFSCFIALLSGCVSYQPLSKSNIQNVYVLFKDTTQVNYDGHKLYDGTIIKWDRKHIGVKAALNRYRFKLDSLREETPTYILNFLAEKSRIEKYRPIKTIPFQEFGYIKTKSNQLIFYGKGRKILIDLTNAKIYH